MIIRICYGYLTWEILCHVTNNGNNTFCKNILEITPCEKTGYGTLYTSVWEIIRYNTRMESTRCEKKWGIEIQRFNLNNTF